MSLPARMDVQGWMLEDGTRAVLAALRAAGGDVRFVGGCVRNSLLRLPVGDIDLATTLHPEATMRALSAAGLHAVPTGLAHGTVTAIAFGRAYEITTLRRDVVTDGRHAVVAFTEDWAVDARRRDFTLNALYADESGTVLDPVGGLADLEARCVRFVGEADQRIREDYLRVLRFFRFSAWYGTPPYDAVGLAACAAAADRLDRLSGERVRKELLVLLAASAPTLAAQDMLAAGVVQHWLPEASGSTEDLARLVAIEAIVESPDGLRRLAALLQAGSDAQVVASRLKLSRHEAERLVSMLAAERDGDGPRAWRRAIYRLGREQFIDRLLLMAARSAAALGAASSWRQAYALATSWNVPKLAIKGADVVASGISPGAEVGMLLHAVEGWWIDGDFAADRDACLARLATEISLRRLTC